MSADDLTPRPARDSWSQVSDLLDEVMDLPPEARPAWLAALAAVDARAASAVGSWLAELDAMESDAFLEER